MTFEDQLNALIFFYLEEHTSARHLIQVLQEDDFARTHVAPEGGISRSSFSEAINERGLEQFMAVFEQLQKQAGSLLPKKYAQLGELVSIDGSLIESFFAWWKRHLRVYHLIARTKQGLMVQILSGLITYLLLAIYCHEEHGERVSIRRVRELRTKILNETRGSQVMPPGPGDFDSQNQEHFQASP